MSLTATPAADPSAVLAIARAWIGTPYLHQSSVQGVGADCLGLARGIWRGPHGGEPWEVPPYTRDWGEAGGREVLATAARAALIEVPVETAGPGALILFRMVAGSPAKHCGVLGEGIIRPTLIHAYDRSGVIEEGFTPAWARRAVFAFLFPAASFPELEESAARVKSDASPAPFAEVAPTGAAAPDQHPEPPATPETGEVI